jgi:ribonuclease HI
MKQAKYYVVWSGKKPGIYPTWESCLAQVSGFPEARYKAFSTRAEAEKAFSGKYAGYSGKPASSQKWLLAKQAPIKDSYVVDAACSGSPGRLEWRGLHLGSGKLLFHQGPFQRGTNNIGEFLAVVQALQLLDQKGLNLPVYSDSGTAIAWVRRNACNTSLKMDGRNRLLFSLITLAEKWLQEHPARAKVLKWDTQAWGEIPADFNRK